MDASNTRITIAVAIIGLIGTLGASFISSGGWKKSAESESEKSAGDLLTKPAEIEKTQVCVPRLSMPKAGQIMTQNPSVGGKYEVKWTFGWFDCPEAQKYHLYIVGPGALNPIVNESDLSAAVYEHHSYHYGITKLRGWSWKVRAFSDNKWGEWSKTRYFDVSPK